ncbi:MAG: tRNA glutamyl-Q(34) synthetase GluQRS [Pseudomonadota bacterium]
MATTSPPPVYRFAPSPNGYLHLGHARSALIAFEAARATGGRFLLRLEDIDLSRRRAAFVDAIFEDLAWLGLTWEEPVWFQSSRLEAYETAWRSLEKAGLLYPCFATRREIADAAGPAPPRDPDGAPLYPGVHANLPPAEIAARMARNEPYARRLNNRRARAHVGFDEAPLTYRTFTPYASLPPSQTEPALPDALIETAPERWGDAVITRKDVATSYHLAVVVDDAAQGITHVTRGADLEAATDLHRLLQALLGLPPPLYHHHALVCDETGRKLSKSEGATSLRSLRRAGHCVAAVRAMAGLAD